MVESKFEASVGMSRKWDAREAGREVAETAIKNLSRPPDFFLLFSTIHYEKYGGFQEFLNGVWDVLPKGTPLIGGTVAGFMNNYGCYARGASALAVSYSNMDVAVGIGHNAKRNPKKAVEKCMKNLKLKNDYNNKILLEFLPTAIIPNIPTIGQKVIIPSESIGNNMVKLLPGMSYLNMGYDRADEIIEMLSDDFSDYRIIGGCTMDDNKMLRSYQFFNDECFKNSLCLLEISSDIKQNIEGTTAFKVLDKGFEITKLSRDLHIIKEINNKKAKTAFLDFFHWEETDLSELYHFYRRIFYYPFGFQKNNTWHTCMMGGLWGENIILSVKAESNKMRFLSLSTEKLLNNTKNLLAKLDKNNIHMCFSVACETFIETLGDKIYSFQNLFSTHLEKTPYLIVFMAGESIYTAQEGHHHLYESINLLTM
jgi:hypothetical protein